MLRNLHPISRSSLGGQVISLIGFTLLATLAIFSLSVFYFVNRSESIAWQGRQSEAARNAAGAVSGFIQRVRDALVVVSIVEPDHLVSDPDELNTLLEENPALVEIVRLDREGRILASTSRGESVLDNLITIPQSQWFLQARDGKTYFSDVQYSSNNAPYLIMAVPGADKGVVSAWVEMGVLWDVVGNIRFGRSGRFVVINQTGDVIAHTDQEAVISMQSLHGRAELSAIQTAPNFEWSGTYEDFNEERVVAASAPVPGTDWIVIAELPRSEAFASSRSAVFVLGIEALLLLLTAGLVVRRFVCLLIVNPMEQLRDGAERIGQGDLHHRIDLNRKDEIGQLASAFNTMAGSLQQQQAQVALHSTTLKANETSLRLITDNMYDVIMQIGVDGTILYASPSHQWVLGIDPAEVTGKTVGERLHPDDLAEAFAIFSQAVAEGGRPKSFTLRYRHVNGQYLWMECVSTILRDEQGEFAGAVLSSRDISERKRMEMELGASEQRYRMLADNVRDVIWSADMNLQMNYISPAVQEMFGFSVEEALAQGIIQNMTPESAAYALSFFAQTMMELETGPKEQLKGASRVIELELTRKDGSTIWTEVKVSFLLDEHGKPIGLLGVTRDITERRQAEEIRQKVLAYEYETRRANELARSNAMILALSRVAVLLENTSNQDLLLETLGLELQKLNMQCAVAAIDPSGETATIQYVSLQGMAVKKIEKMVGISLKKYKIPKRYWPGDRIFKDKGPFWYPNPRGIIHRMFPIVPNFLADPVWKLLGIQPEGMICILPLLVNEKVIGAMPIWGSDLYQTDSPILAIFAGQVASILEKTIVHENETRRANELARSNSMILALSNVAAQLESTYQTAEIFDLVSRELKLLGMESLVGLFDGDKQNLHIQHMSVQQDVVRWAEKITGHSLSELSIPRYLWPTDRVLTNKTAYWDPKHMKGMLKMFPVLSSRLHASSLKMAGINLDDPICYLPLMNEQDVFGILAVWGAGLKENDVSAFSILANQITTAIRNNRLLETESQRARELDILLKASEATSSSLDFDEVLHTLASQLLEISGFESCFISEWDKETNSVVGRLDHSSVFWREDLRDSFSMGDYPRSHQVLLTGDPIILQGNFEAEEKKWMTALKRTAVIILALYSQDKIIGLVEIETLNKAKQFDPQMLYDCREILANAAPFIEEPLSANKPRKLFEIQEALLQITGADVCSFSEWDTHQNKVHNLAVSTRITWATGQGSRFNPDLETWRQALDEGRTITFLRSESTSTKAIVFDGVETMDVESLIIFPLQKGHERIGVIELYDFNHEIHITPEQITFLKTIVDKASYSIENARLLQLTQKKLEEQTGLLNEKEVLLKEIHHRVKNNLQIISSLLNLQTDQVTDAGMLRALRDSQTRVRSMALIHEKLYQSKSLAKIDFGEYVQSLAKDLFRSYQRTLGDIRLNIHVDQVTLDLDYAVPCGLILNELMTNALKYAFPDGRNGSIRVELRSEPDQFLSLKVADDGVGFPPGLDILKNKSLGLQLVNSLVKQIGGKLEFENSTGTAFRVTFKV